VDLHGEDETKAAQKAVRDAIGGTSMVGLGRLFKARSFREIEEALMIDVTVAAPNPSRIDGEAVLSVLPEGRRRINIVEGGIRFPVPTTTEEAKTHSIVVAIAVIVVLVDVDRFERYDLAVSTE